MEETFLGVMRIEWIACCFIALVGIFLVLVIDTKAYIEKLIANKRTFLDISEFNEDSNAYLIRGMTENLNYYWLHFSGISKAGIPLYSWKRKIKGACIFLKEDAEEFFKNSKLFEFKNSGAFREYETKHISKLKPVKMRFFGGFKNEM